MGGLDFFLGYAESNCRVLARTGLGKCWDGSEVFSCDVGDENSDAVVKLNPVQITRGAPGAAQLVSALDAVGSEIAP